MKTSKILVLIAFIIAFIFNSCEENIKDLPPSEIYINMPEDGYELKVTDTLVISPKITYDYNSTYKWISDGEVVWTEKDLQLIPSVINLYSYVFTVENDRGTDSIDIWTQSMYITDYEDLVLYDASESNEVKDTFWVNSELHESFISDSLIFEVNGNYNSDSWTGFTYSNMAGNKSTDELDKYSCYKAPTTFESDNFGIMMQNDIQTPLYIETSDGKNHLFKSLMVNNSYYVYDAIKNGNHGSKVFGGTDGTEADWFLLTITGFNNSGTQRGTVEFYLANYTFGNNRDNFIITSWSTIDLEPLGEVSKLRLELSSSDVENNKMMTPGFVCLDEIKIIK